MKKTLLKFPSAIYLIAFRRYAKAAFWEIDLSKLTVYCDCSNKELKVACNDFKAVVLESNETAEASIRPEEAIPAPVEHYGVIHPLPQTSTLVATS